MEAGLPPGLIVGGGLLSDSCLHLYLISDYTHLVPWAPQGSGLPYFSLSWQSR